MTISSEQLKKMNNIKVFTDRVRKRHLDVKGLLCGFPAGEAVLLLNPGKLANPNPIMSGGLCDCACT